MKRRKHESKIEHSVNNISNGGVMAAWRRKWRRESEAKHHDISMTAARRHLYAINKMRRQWQMAK